MKQESRFVRILILAFLIMSLMAPITNVNAIAQESSLPSATPVVEPANEDASAAPLGDEPVVTDPVATEEDVSTPKPDIEQESVSSRLVSPLAAVEGLPQLAITSETCVDGRAIVTYQVTYNADFTAPATVLDTGPYTPTYTDFVGSFTVPGNYQFMISTSWIGTGPAPELGSTGLPGLNWTGGEGYFFVQPTAPNTACPAGDVSITKTRIAYTEAGYNIPGSGSVKAGDLIAYRIAVAPTGNTAVFGVTYGDVAPVGTNLVAGVPENGSQSCYQQGGGMYCETTDSQYLEPENSLSFILLVRVQTPAPQAVCDNGLVNTAYLSRLNGTALATSRESASVSIDVQCPRLTISKTVNGASSTTITPGSGSDTITFKITLNSVGDLATSGTITLVDTLPAELRAIPWTITEPASGCSYNSSTGVLRCDSTAPMAVGASFSVVLTGTVTTATPMCGTYTNSAGLIAAGSADPRGVEASASVTITCITQISISKADPPAIAAGGSLQWEILLWNTGNGAGTVTLTDDLPDGFVATSVTADAAAGCQITESGTKVTCTPSVPHNTTEQTALEIGINITIDPAAECKSTSNTATITGSGIVVGSDVGTVQVTCTHSLTFEKTDSLASDDTLVTPGESFTYILSYMNAGPSVARNVVITDTLPAGIELAGDLPEGCSAAGVEITCTISTVPVSTTSSSFSIPVRFVTDLSSAACAAGITNTATLTAPAGSETTELTDTELTKPDCRIDAEVTKTAGVIAVGDDGIAQAGESGNFTITVTNTGTLDITDIVVMDTAGTGELVFGDATGDWDDTPVPVTLAQVDGTDTVAITTSIPPGGIVTIPVTYSLAQADIDAGEARNCATISRMDDTAPELPSAVEACATLNIDQVSGISVQKIGTAETGENDEININETVAYEFIVTNTGNVTLTNVNVVDTIDGVVFDSGTTIPTLVPGVPVTLTGSYVVKQPDIDSGMLQNCATASGVAPDQSTVTSEQSCDTKLMGQNPAIIVLQQCPGVTLENRPQVGDSVSFVTTVTNNGDVTLANVMVDTSRAGSFDTPFPTVFAPGQTEVRQWTTIVTDADYEAGKIDLEISATGQTEAGMSMQLASAVIMQDASSQAENSIMVSCPLEVLAPTPSPTPTQPGEPAPSPTPTQPGEPAPSPTPTQPGEPAPSPTPTQPGEPTATPSPTSTQSGEQTPASTQSATTTPAPQVVGTPTSAVTPATQAPTAFVVTELPSTGSGESGAGPMILVLFVIIGIATLGLGARRKQA